MISASELADRVSPGAEERKAAERFMRPIATTDGTVVGRAALYPSQYGFTDHGALVAGGLRVTGVPHLLGVVPGEVATAARDRGRLVLPAEALSEWATEQVRLIEASNLSHEHKTLCAEVALENGGLILGLPVAHWAGIWLNSDELRSWFSGGDEVSIYVGEVVHEYDDDVPRHVFERDLKLDDGILFISVLNPFSGSKSHLRHLVLEILELFWGGYEEQGDHYRIVGIAGGAEIIRSVEMLRRPKESSFVGRGS